MVYPISKIICNTIVGIFVKKVNGRENIPRKRPFIFCSNHASFLDDVLIPTTVIKKTNKFIHVYTNSRFYKYKFLKKILDHYNCIPICVKKDNYSKKKNREAFKIAISFLKKEESIGIFPEGMRSINGKLKKAKFGAARLALTAKVPVLPIGIIGSYHIWPKSKKFPKLEKRAIINIGKPLYFDKYYGKEKDKKILEKVTRLIMKKIAKLSNQEYNY